MIEADYQNISPVNPSGGGLGKEETESKEDLSKDDQEVVRVCVCVWLHGVSSNTFLFNGVIFV